MRGVFPIPFYATRRTGGGGMWGVFTAPFYLRKKTRNMEASDKKDTLANYSQRIPHLQA